MYEQSNFATKYKEYENKTIVHISCIIDEPVIWRMQGR